MPVAEDAFLAEWRAAVGDTFAEGVVLGLLSVRVSVVSICIADRCFQGNYLSALAPSNDAPTSMLTYFPASALPVEPAARFGELFLTRARWRQDEIAPFLADVAVGAKERDRLLLKHARATTDAEGVWYTARATYNG